MSYKADTEKIAIILDQIIEVLESVHEVFWKKLVQRFRADCEYVESEEEANRLRRGIIHSLGGGMGSFNDLILSSEGKILPEAYELDKLRKKLFNTILDQISHERS